MAAPSSLIIASRSTSSVTAIAPENWVSDASGAPIRTRHRTRRKSPIVDRTRPSPPKGEVHAVVDADHVPCAVGEVDEPIHLN